MFLLFASSSSKFLFLQYHFLQVHFSNFKIILISFKTRMFKLFIVYPAFDYGHNLIIQIRLHSDPFYLGYEIYCSYKSMYKIRVSIIYTSIGQEVWENDLSIYFSAEYLFTERTKTSLCLWDSVREVFLLQ